MHSCGNLSGKPGRKLSLSFLAPSRHHKHTLECWFGTGCSRRKAALSAHAWLGSVWASSPWRSSCSSPTDGRFLTASLIVLEKEYDLLWCSQPRKGHAIAVVDDSWRIDPGERVSVLGVFLALPVILSVLRQRSLSLDPDPSYSVAQSVQDVPLTLLSFDEEATA